MALSATPYDALFRAVVSNRRRAAGLVRDFLPAEVAERLDPGSLPEPVEGSFVDGEGAKTQCDALFRVRLRDGLRPARIYALLEHKSRVDPAAALQVARYMINVWTREVEEHGWSEDRRLPPIFPLVLYHGRGRWTAPLSLAEMVEAPPGFGGPADGFAYGLRDLGRIPASRLPQPPDLRAGLLALREAFSEGVDDAVLDMITGGPVDGSDFERHLMLYVTERLDLAPEALEASLRRTKPERWEALMGTVAQAWMDEGRAKGIAEGIADGLLQGRSEGEAALLLRLLERRFGRLPAAIRDRVRGAAADDLEAWSVAVLDADSLDAVFAKGADA